MLPNGKTFRIYFYRDGELSVFNFTDRAEFLRMFGDCEWAGEATFADETIPVVDTFIGDCDSPWARTALDEFQESI